VQLPSVFTTNLVWASDNPSARDIKRLLSTLRCAVNLGQVFAIPDDGSSSKAEAVEKEKVRPGFPRAGRSERATVSTFRFMFLVPERMAYLYFERRFSYMHLCGVLGAFFSPLNCFFCLLPRHITIALDQSIGAPGGTQPPSPCGGASKDPDARRTGGAGAGPAGKATGRRHQRQGPEIDGPRRPNWAPAHVPLLRDDLLLR